MRAKGSELDPQGSVEISFDGEPVTARRGETVAAALTAHGITALRTTAASEPRGLFCGMGICQDCLVEIDGRSNRRACMTRIVGPIEVRRQSHLATPQQQRTAEAAREGPASLEPDLLVIGGGAGGLTAASVAAEAGLSVVLVDDRPSLGGQYFKQPAEAVPLPPEAEDAQFAGGRALIDRARAVGVDMVNGAAINATLPLAVTVSVDGGATVLRPRRLIVATGAYERPLPVPGWTLPGVMTTGAAQTLLRSYRVLPGRQVLVCGNGPLNLQVALELHRAGAEVLAVAEQAARPSLSQLAAVAGMASSAPQLLARGLAYVAELRRAGIALLYETVLEGVDVGLNARLLSGRGAGSRLTYRADAVCMGYGFLPSNELLRMLGCRHRFDEARASLVTVRDAAMATSVPEVYAIGDCCGIGGALAAQDEGVIAGIAAAQSLGRPMGPGLARKLQRARRRLGRQRRFQAALWRFFAAGRPAARADRGVILCRCEELSHAEFDDALENGADSIGSVKRLTRLGMGRCQGRYCGPIATELLARRHGGPPGEFDFPAPRPPLRPVSIASIAGSSTEHHK